MLDICSKKEKVKYLNVRNAELIIPEEIIVIAYDEGVCSYAKVIV